MILNTHYALGSLVQISSMKVWGWCSEPHGWGL